MTVDSRPAGAGQLESGNIPSLLFAEAPASGGMLASKVPGWPVKVLLSGTCPDVLDQEARLYDRPSNLGFPEPYGVRFSSKLKGSSFTVRTGLFHQKPSVPLFFT